jgi:hypothetical protein
MKLIAALGFTTLYLYGEQAFMYSPPALVVWWNIWAWTWFVFAFANAMVQLGSNAWGLAILSVITCTHPIIYLGCCSYHLYSLLPATVAVHTLLSSKSVLNAHGIRSQCTLRYNVTSVFNGTLGAPCYIAYYFSLSGISDNIFDGMNFLCGQLH